MSDVQGYVIPSKSWPREATPCDLVPQWAGEFVSFEDWVNFARQRLTGAYDPHMSVEVPSVCIDAFGRRCTHGGHFMRARDEGAFPVRYLFDFRPAAKAETRSSHIGVGMVIAAAVCAGRGEDVMAEDILYAAGLTTMADMRSVGADAYDVRILRHVLKELKRKDAVRAAA